ncbi:MAG: ABC transporter permease [Burkholderiales bacterium]|nr:ABC transporter permease [Burkholderiales bacterium]
MSALPDAPVPPAGGTAGRFGGGEAGRLTGWAAPAGHVLLLWRCITRLTVLRKPMVRLVFLRQVYFSGVLGLRPIALLALATGGLAVTQATVLLGATNALLHEILAWLLVTEAAPLFVAVVVLGRSVTVIATDLALMRVRGEIRSLARMRIDPLDYLAVPRIAALAVALLASTLYYQLIAVAGGLGAAALLLNVSYGEQLRLFLDAIGWGKLLVSGVKSLVFGLVMGTIACFAGLNAGETIGEVPRAQILAYMRCLTALVAIDLLFAFAGLRFTPGALQ